MELKPGFSEVYGEGGGFRHRGGEGSEEQFGVGIVASMFFARFHGSVPKTLCHRMRNSGLPLYQSKKSTFSAVDNSIKFLCQCIQNSMANYTLLE